VESLVGTVLGRFRVTRLIGTGGMGEVYAAVDSSLDREVALKVLGKALDVEPHRRRFLREARLAARLSHPNIASIYEVGDTDGRRYIVMELLEGQTLRAQMAERRLTVEESLSIARDVVRALGKAHAGDVVHRDVKPENIFVTTPSRGVLLAKVLDFGLARDEMLLKRTDDEETATDITGPGQACGTAGYLAPEQARGLGVDARADIFAFGAVFYEMLCGKRAFDGKSQLVRMLAVVKPHEPLRSRMPDVSPDIERIVERCLAKDPDERYPNASELLADIEEALDARPPSPASLPSASFNPDSEPFRRSLEFTETPAPITRSERIRLEPPRRAWPFLVAGGGLALAAFLVVVSSSGVSPQANSLAAPGSSGWRGIQPSGEEGVEAPTEKAAAVAMSPTASASAAPPPAPLPAEVPTTGTVRFQSIDVMTVVVDGEHHRVRDNGVTLACGRHRVRVGLRAERTVEVPCGGSVLF
jgi:serine/threonine protein kinase